MVFLAVTLKHYLADFVLQSNWMARGKERVQGWFYPLLAHVSVHAAVMMVIVLMLRPGMWWLAAGDFAVHASIDRAKARVSHATGWPPSDERFWWLLGFDQCLHHLTNVGAVALLILA